MHAFLATILVIGPPNFAETLLVTILNNPDHFQLDPTSFRKLFIFVHFGHYMNSEQFLANLMTRNDRIHCILQIKARGGGPRPFFDVEHI